MAQPQSLELVDMETCKVNASEALEFQDIEMEFFAPLMRHRPECGAVLRDIKQARLRIKRRTQGHDTQDATHAGPCATG